MVIYTGALFHSYDGDVHWCYVSLVWWWCTLVLCSTRMMVIYTGALFHSYDGDVHWCSVSLIWWWCTLVLCFRVLSSLAHWSPIFGETEYLPLLTFPFVKLFQNNQLVCFEVISTVLSKSVSGCYYDRYAIIPLWSVCHYDQYAIMIGMPLWLHYVLS